jgi:opacity protein-like surface antigen
MNKKLSMLLLIVSSPLYAGDMGAGVNYPWFASIGTGYSWTEKPGIVNPNSLEWDAAIQGYNGSLGNRGFYTFAVGKQIHRYVDLSLGYLNHETFNYQQFQSGVSETPGFTGAARTRYFTLVNRAVLANVFLRPEQRYFSVSSVGFTPFIGAGIGYALNQVNNFYTVGSTTVSGVAIGSTDSIGSPVSKNSFAWQGSVGFNIKPDISHVSVDLGYRYFDGGQFAGSSNIYVNASGWTSATPWAGTLIANQAFIEFKYTV